MTSKLRILYVPNEANDFRQVGFRRPLANLLSAGLVADVSVFSLQWRIQNGGDPEAHRQDLIDRVKDFQPNLVYMQHLGTTGLRAKHFREMRKAAEFEFIYHEADPYSRALHPLPVSARVAGRFADVVFTVGAGVFSDNFRRAGASDVRWAPSALDPERFRMNSAGTESTKEFDVVVVANRNTPRLRGLPDWKDRIRFVEQLQERMGSRVAIYGNGWTGEGAMGPVPFSEQVDVIRKGWISANWDHFASEPLYFSNRLPISLSAGSIHATTSHPGYASIFPVSTHPFLIREKTTEGLITAMERHLAATSPTERTDASRAGQEFVYRYFRQDDHLIGYLNYRMERVSLAAAQACWQLDAAPLDEL